MHEYNKKFLGEEHFDAHTAALGESFFTSLSNPAVSNDVMVCQSPIHGSHPCKVTWCHSLSSPLDLCTTGFGRPDLLHSFLVELCLDSCIYHVLRFRDLVITALILLCAILPLVLHLASSIVRTRFYDFRWLQTHDPAWQRQTHISPTKQVAMMACLLFYKLDTSLLMRYVGNNYSGA